MLKAVVATVDIVSRYSMLSIVLCHLVVISPYKFSICDVTGDEFASYSGGGVVLQVKTPISLTFVSSATGDLLL